MKKKLSSTREVLVELQDEVKKIREDFNAHTTKEDPQLTAIAEDVATIKGQMTLLNAIRLNGDGRTYTIEGALQLLYGVVKEEKAKKEEETKKRAAQTPAITQPAQQPATQPIVNIPPSQPAQQSAKAAESTSAPMPFVAIENPPEIIHHEPAKYPDIAIKMGIQGRVTVEVTVDAQGKPIQTKVVKSPSDVFNDAAVEAVMKYTFKPAMTITGPVTAKVYIPIDFRLR